jgi:ubiquinone/menaquinone biosynthesis C-methylase UbiE
MSGTATQQAVNPADSLSSYFSNLSKTSTSDHTWRASAARCFSTHVTVSPGQRILHLACGTGNLTFILADRVGPTGRVIGLDFTPSKLDRAITTKKHDLQKYANVDFHLVDDLLQLPTVPGLQGQEQTFDMLTMGYTLLLFPDPAAAILYWKRYLKPGGILAVDSTDARNLLAGLALEQTCKILELPMPRHKLWSMKKHTLRRTLEDCDFRVEKVVTIGDEAEWGKRYYEVAEWDDDFAEKVILGDVDLRRTLEYRSSRQRAQDVSKKEYRSSQKIAQDVFKEEWEKLATKDRFVEVNAVFLCIARKREFAIIPGKL